MYAKLLIALIMCLCGIHAQHDGECPQCTDPYNPASCTGRQNCHDQSCELHVHRGDRNRIEYTCAHGQSCHNHQAHDCSNNHGTCSYCCQGYDACLNELNELFADVSTTSTPEEPSTTSASADFSTTSTPEELSTTSASTDFSTTSNPEELSTTSASTDFSTTSTSEELSTTSASTDFSTTSTPEEISTTSVSTDFSTTSNPEELSTTSASTDFSTTSNPEELSTTSASTDFSTTSTPEELSTTSASTDFSTTSTSEELSTTSAIPATTHAPHSCVQCGDFAFDKPCTPIELLLNDASACPEGLPYCFETVSINGGNLQVVRGCAEANFCRVEWDIGHARPGCYPLDVSASNVSCTYCCSDDSCNNITPPLDDSQVPFP